jgi:hypothetical protein
MSLYGMVSIGQIGEECWACAYYLYRLDPMGHEYLTCLSLLIIYFVHLNSPWIVLNMIYGVNNEIITQKILNHKPCKFIILYSQSVIKLSIPFVKTVIIHQSWWYILIGLICSCITIRMQCIPYPSSDHCNLNAQQKHCVPVKR